MYIAMKSAERKGVYREENFKNEWRGKGVSVRKFEDNELVEALEWAGVKSINGATINVKQFLKKYRNCKDFKIKMKMISKLNKEEKTLITFNFTPKEVEEYKKHASALIERRYNCIKKYKNCLDELTSDNPSLKKIGQNYIHLDLSIPVYTIKAIINVHDGIGFSRDDGKYSKNADKYYKECRRYWDRIIERWDTDTGVLSPEDIENKNFSEYHKNANKVKTIIKQLKEWKKDNQYMYRGEF